MGFIQNCYNNVEMAVKNPKATCNEFKAMPRGKKAEVILKTMAVAFVAGIVVGTFAGLIASPVGIILGCLAASSGAAIAFAHQCAPRSFLENAVETVRQGTGTIVRGLDQ